MIVQHLSLTPRILLLPSLLLLFLVERERTGNVFEIHRIRCDPLFSLPFRFTVQIGRTAARGDRDPRGSVIATSFDFLLVLDAINTSGISLFQTERRKKKKRERERNER